MENGRRTGCGYTVGEGVREAMAQLDIWRHEIRRQAAAMQKTVAAADALALLWDSLDEITKGRIDTSIQLREKLRALIGYYGFD